MELTTHVRRHRWNAPLSAVRLRWRRLPPRMVTTVPQQSRQMTLSEYMTALTKRWFIILALLLVGAAAAYGYSQYLEKQYRSEATVMVIPNRGESTSELVQGSSYVQNLMQSYAILATSPTVLAPVVDELDLGEAPYTLARRVEVNVPLNTSTMDIRVTDADPERARRTADAIAEQLADAVGAHSPMGVDDRPAVRIDTISPARTPLAPIAPNTRLNMIIGGVIGGALGVAYALLRHALSGRISNRDELADTTSLPVLGEVALLTEAATLPSTLLAAPSGPVAEAMRSVSAGLRYVDAGRDRRVLMVTSATSGEGKTSISLALALTLAEVGNRVLYVEADLRRPTAASFTDLEGAVGLTTVIIGEAVLADVVQPWGHENLDILLSGKEPPNPGQLVSGGSIKAIIDEARAAYDIVVVDTPPVLAVSDAQWLAPLSDGILLVVRLGRAKRDEVRRSVSALASTRGEAVGVILNGSRSVAKSPYHVPAKPDSRVRGSVRKHFSPPSGS